MGEELAPGPAVQDEPGEVTVERCALSHPDARTMIAALDAELSAAYPAEANYFSLTVEETAPGSGTFVVARIHGRPVGCAALRVVDESSAEVKRMYVAPDVRGARIGARLLGALEVEARRLGRERLVLETGTKQAAAIRLYQREGFVPTSPFGDYVASEHNTFFEKSLVPADA